MDNEDKLLDDIQNLLNDNKELINETSKEDNEDSDEKEMSIKEKTNEIKSQRQKDSIIINRHLGYKRKYLEEKRWVKTIFYLMLITLCAICICYLMPYKG